LVCYFGSSRGMFGSPGYLGTPFSTGVPMERDPVTCNDEHMRVVFYCWIKNRWTDEHDILQRICYSACANRIVHVIYMLYIVCATGSSTMTRYNIISGSLIFDSTAWSQWHGSVPPNRASQERGRRRPPKSPASVRRLPRDPRGRHLARPLLSASGRSSPAPLEIQLEQAWSG
jgi:hypothetical protein